MPHLQNLGIFFLNTSRKLRLLFFFFCNSRCILNPPQHSSKQNRETVMKTQDCTCAVKFLQHSIPGLQLMLCRCEITPAAGLGTKGTMYLRALDYSTNSSSLLKIHTQGSGIPNKLKTFPIDPLFSPILTWKQEPASLSMVQ